MKIIQPGHIYLLDHLDGEGKSVLTFVKRIGEKYPYNQLPAYEGTTIQEVLRALINRVMYVNHQHSAQENLDVIDRLRMCIVRLELRAARVGEYKISTNRIDIENEETCKQHLHIQCGKCKKETK